MEQEITFTACEHLDFSDNYAATKELISAGNETKVCWNRPTIDSTYPSLVQFCKKRGRMNHPLLCLCEEKQGCSDYNDFEHTVTYTPDL